MEFLDESRKKERVSSEWAHGGGYFIQVVIDYSFVNLGCTALVVAFSSGCLYCHVQRYMYMYTVNVTFTDILSTDTGVHCQYAGGRESSDFHWEKDHVSMG